MTRAQQLEVIIDNLDQQLEIKNEMITQLKLDIKNLNSVIYDMADQLEEDNLSRIKHYQERNKGYRDIKERYKLPVVKKSLPTNECIEQWWAEGQDQKEGFWQEAPYRTNGDVVEEIKTALKYFIETWQM